MSFAAKQRQRLCSPDTISQIHHPRLSRATPPAQARIVRPAPGAGETSPQVRAPPARTPAETLTSGELFTVRLYGCARLRRASRQRRASPAGASTRSGRASLARTSGVTPTTDDVGLLLSQTEIHFSRRETSIMVIAVIHCSFPLPAVVTERGHPAPCGAIKSVIPAPLWIASLHAGETSALPGGAGTRPVVARQEHARTTVGCPGRQAS